MFKEKFPGGERQFSQEFEKKPCSEWNGSDLIERIENIKNGFFDGSKRTIIGDSKESIPSVEVIIFKNLDKIQKKELSGPLQKIVEEIARRLEKRE